MTRRRGICSSASGSSSRQTIQIIAPAAKQASQSGVGGTPTFVLVKPPGKPTMLKLTALDPAAFKSALDSGLQ